jgi:hypothetical protein
MAGYSAMKFNLDKNNLQYFTFSPNSEKPIKAVIHHLPPDTPTDEATDDQSNSTIWTSPRGNLPSIPCYLNKKHKISRDIQVE